METNDRDLSPMLTGYWISQVMYVAAKLELADHLHAAPRTAAELAAMTGTNVEALYRLLRALAGLGMVSSAAAGADCRFTLGAKGTRLRKDVPDSQWAMAVMAGEEHYRAWGELLYSVRTGKPSFDHLYGEPVFDFLAHHPEQGAIFDAAMTGFHGRETAAILAVYDFSSHSLVADIGGGNGSTLSAILTHYPHLRGMLFDLPAVIERHRARLAGSSVGPRLQFESGSFFEALPAGPDAYFFRHIIHDWSDEECRKILRNCRAVIPARGKLLIAETVIPAGDEFSFAKLLDLTMLVIPGGKERTADEYRDLLRESGFDLERIDDTTENVSVIVGVPRS